MSAELWVKTLFTYGPFAILVFLVFVAERKLWNASKAAPDRKGLFRLYVANWLVIFGVVAFSVYAWKRMNLDRKPEIRGTIENLSNLETLGTTCADLYLHRIPKSTTMSDYEWVLVNRDKRFAAGTKIRFTIQAPRANSKEDDLYEYELPMQPTFYENTVLLRHKPGKLFLDDNGQEKELSGGLLPGNTQPTSARLETSWDFFPVAYAQSPKVSSIEDFSVGLESPDAVVRRKARAELATQDQATAIPWICKVLKDDKSSYRLKLGVIVALNNMQGLQRQSLDSSLVTAVQKNLNDPDPALRSEAFTLAAKYNFVPVIVYQDTNYSGKSQGFGVGKFRADQGQLGNLPNDSASSIFVAPGYQVRLCDSEGYGNGYGRCEIMSPGWNQLHSARMGGVADMVSFIEVRKIDYQQRRIK